MLFTVNIKACVIFVFVLIYIYLYIQSTYLEYKNDIFFLETRIDKKWFGWLTETGHNICWIFIGMYTSTCLGSTDNAIFLL